MLRCVRVSSGPTAFLTETVKVFQGELEDFQEHAQCLQVFTMSREILSPMCSRQTRPQTGCVHDIDVAAVVKLGTVIDIKLDIDQVSHTPLDGIWPLPSARHQPHLSSRAGLLLS